MVSSTWSSYVARSTIGREGPNVLNAPLIISLLVLGLYNFKPFYGVTMYLLKICNH